MSAGYSQTCAKLLNWLKQLRCQQSRGPSVRWIEALTLLAPCIYLELSVRIQMPLGHFCLNLNDINNLPPFNTFQQHGSKKWMHHVPWNRGPCEDKALSF
ncbi:hypothetical protein SRHO_G00046800 [Serrasalmus rhombeus]